MDWPDDVVRLGRQEAVQQMIALDRIGLGPACPAPIGPDAGERDQRPAVIHATHFGVLRGLVSAYSQNDDIGTKHLDSGVSHRRQCGELVLRMLVVIPGYCGGFGMPQRIMASSRSPLLTRTTGATPSGKIAGIGGRLPALSLVTLNRSRIAAWLVVTE